MNLLNLKSALNLMAAYLDPGSGSLLIQLIIAGIVGAGIFIRARWEKVKRILGIGSPEVDESESEGEDFDV